MILGVQGTARFDLAPGQLAHMTQEPNSSDPSGVPAPGPLNLQALAGTGLRAPHASRPRGRPSFLRVCLGLAWSAALAAGGGVLCAWIQREGWFLFSIVVLWLLGLPGGLIARGLTGGPSGMVAFSQAAALVGALVIMQTIWLHENHQPRPDWTETLVLLPAYYKTNTLQAVSEAICGVCGAYVAGERLLRAPRRRRYA